MPNTYINDRMTEPYPFVVNNGDAALPFPNSVITELRLCVPDAVSSVYVDKISLDALHAVVTVAGTVEGKTWLLCTISAAVDSLDGTSVVTPLCDEIAVSGFMAVGIIPSSCTGVYKGPFILHAGCVMKMPSYTNGTILKVSDGESYYATTDSLSIKTAGGLTLDGTFKTASGSPLSVQLTGSTITNWIDTGEDADDKVTYINGISTRGGTILNIRTADASSASSAASVAAVAVNMPSTVATSSFVIDGATTITPITSTSDSIVCVTLTGGTDFPNCYKAAQDGADIADKDQPEGLNG